MEDPGINWKIILRWILKSYVGYGLDRGGSDKGQVAGTCECGNEYSGYIKCQEFLDQLKTGYFLRKDCAAWS